MDVGSIGQTGLNIANLATAAQGSTVSNATNQDSAAKRIQQEVMAAGSAEATQVRASNARQGTANVDQAEEYVEQARQTEAYDATSQVVQAQNQMVGRAINLMA